MKIAWKIRLFSCICYLSLKVKLLIVVSVLSCERACPASPLEPFVRWRLSPFSIFFRNCKQMTVSRTHPTLRFLSVLAHPRPHAKPVFAQPAWKRGHLMPFDAPGQRRASENPFRACPAPLRAAQNLTEAPLSARTVSRLSLGNAACTSYPHWF